MILLDSGCIHFRIIVTNIPVILIHLVYSNSLFHYCFILPYPKYPSPCPSFFLSFKHHRNAMTRKCVAIFLSKVVTHRIEWFVITPLKRKRQCSVPTYFMLFLVPSREKTKELTFPGSECLNSLHHFGTRVLQ